MDPKRKLSDAADLLSEETIARRRSRRVSFAETTAVHVFERDESTESPHETSSDSGGKSTGGKSAGSESSDDDDGPPMKFIMDREDFSPGSASNASVASNDDDNFFGPVSMKFLKSGRFSDSGISEDNNDNNDDNINNNHEITLDSTQFSLHFKNIGTDISATSTSNLMTPTGTATPASTVSNIEPNRAKKTNSDIKSSEGLGDFSLVAETEMIDFGKLSPSLGKLIQGVEALRKPNFQEKHQENENEIILHTPKAPLSNSKSSPGSIHSLREKRAKLFGDLSLTNNPSIDSEFMKHGKIISEINDSIVKNTPKSKLVSNSAGLDFKKAFSAIKDSVGKKTSVVKEISISTRLNFENENEGEKLNLNFENEDEGEKLNLNFEKKNENVNSDLNFENVNENVVSNLNFENWNENVVVNLNFDNENENVVSNCPKELSLKAKKAQIDHKLEREHARRRQIEQENLEREDHGTKRLMEESLEREDHATKRQIEQNLEREDHARKRQIEKNLEREEHARDRLIDRNLEGENHPRNGQTEQNLEREEPARKQQTEQNLEREKPARKQQTEQNLEREKPAKKLHARKRQIDQSSERENHARKGQIEQNVERDHAGERQIEQNVEREDHARKRQLEQNVERENNARKPQIEQNLETEEPARKHIRIEKSPNCRVESPSFDWREVVSNLSDMTMQIFSLSFKKLSLNELDLLLSILEKQQTASKDASVSALVKARNSRDRYQERLAEATLLHDNHLYDKAMLELTQLKHEKLKGLISKLGQMNHQLSFYRARIEKLRQPIDDCLTSSSNNVHLEEQDKLKEKRQALEKLEQNLKNLCTSIQVRCKLPNNLSCDETIKIAKENLKERKLCRSFHQAIWPWVPTLNKDNNKEEIVLKYYDFLFQRFTMGTSNSSDILVTDTLNKTKIEETFKGMNAYSAFDFVFKDKKRNFNHIWQATMETGLVLSNLINVLNEVMRAKVELLNLNYVNFNSNETSSKLELQMVFMSFKGGKNLAVSLDMTDLKSAVYPDSSELRVVIDQSATTIDEAILTNIMSKIQNLESGPQIIVRLCKTVSQLVHSSAV